MREQEEGEVRGDRVRMREGCEVRAGQDGRQFIPHPPVVSRNEVICRAASRSLTVNQLPHRRLFVLFIYFFIFSSFFFHCFYFERALPSAFVTVSSPLPPPVSSSSSSLHL